MDKLVDDERRPAVVPLEFWVDYENDPARPGQKRETAWVRWVRKGTNGATTEDKVSRVERHNPPVWTVLRPYWEAWRDKRAAPVEGTPLAAWPGATPALVRELERVHLRSVEDLAEAGEGELLKVGVPGLRDLQQRARAYLAAIDRDAAAAELTIRDVRIAELEGQVAALEVLVAELAQQSGHKRRDRPADAAAAHPAVAEAG